MCKSIAEGGQRCASHTRVAYQQKLNSYLNRASSRREEMVNQSQDLIEAATLFATTRKGIAEIEALISECGDDENKRLLVEDLSKALAEGRRQREITQEVEAEIYLRKHGEPKKKSSQASIVRGHLEKLNSTGIDAVLKSTHPLFDLGYTKAVTNLDDLEKVVQERLALAQGAIADAYRKFLREAKIDLKDNMPSSKEMAEIEMNNLDRQQGLTRLEYYQRLFAIEDKYSKAPEKFVYQVTGHYAGDNYRDGAFERSLGVFSTLEVACAPQPGHWDSITITRVEIE